MPGHKPSPGPRSLPCWPERAHFTYDDNAEGALYRNAEQEKDEVPGSLSPAGIVAPPGVYQGQRLNERAARLLWLDQKGLKSLVRIKQIEAIPVRVPLASGLSIYPGKNGGERPGGPRTAPAGRSTTGPVPGGVLKSTRVNPTVSMELTIAREDAHPASKFNGIAMLPGPVFFHELRGLTKSQGVHRPDRHRALPPLPSGDAVDLGGRLEGAVIEQYGVHVR